MDEEQASYLNNPRLLFVASRELSLVASRDDVDRLALVRLRAAMGDHTEEDVA